MTAYLTLGEFAQMEDADIAAMVKTEHARQISEKARSLEDEQTFCLRKKGELADAGLLEDVLLAENDKLRNIFNMLNAVAKMYYDYALAQREAYLQAAQEPFPYRLTIVTDMTGNHTSHMKLVYRSLNEQGYSYPDISLHYLYPTGPTTSNSYYVVYDSLYGGYLGDKVHYFTRVNKEVHFVLDEVGTCDLPTDVKDYETLFA